VNGTSWDTTTANWTNAANGTITVYQEHNNGITIAGDTVNFDNTLTNDFVNPQPTNVNLTAVFHPFPVTVNSTLAYSIAGAGGLAGSSGNTGIPYLTKNNTGSLTLLTSNSFTGGVSILGGQVVITNDFSLGATNGLVALNGGSLQINNGTTNTFRPFTLTGASTIGVASNAIARYGGVFSGTGGLTKTNYGTLTLAGANTYAGNTFVNLGTLVVDSGGSVSIPNGIYSSIGQVGNDIGTLTLMGTGSFKDGNDFNLGDIGNSAGTLNIQDTATLTVNSLYVGSANAASSATIGTVNQIGGTVTQTNTTAGDFTIGGRNAATTGAIGTYNLSSGTVNASSAVRVGVTEAEPSTSRAARLMPSLVVSTLNVWVDSAPTT
jgi:autotransporter-associated beta strand protein